MNIQNTIVHWETLDLLEVAVDYLVDCSNIRSILTSSTIYLTPKLTLASGATAHGSVSNVCPIPLMFDVSSAAIVTKRSHDLLLFANKFVLSRCNLAPKVHSLTT